MARKKKERQSSPKQKAYRSHIKVCMKAKAIHGKETRATLNQNMKECAEEYRKLQDIKQ